MVRWMRSGPVPVAEVFLNFLCACLSLCELSCVWQQSTSRLAGRGELCYRIFFGASVFLEVFKFSTFFGLYYHISELKEI